MKKKIVALLTFLAHSSAYALAVRNPTEASLFLHGLYWESCGCCDLCNPYFDWCDAWSVRVGYAGDFVFDRHLHVGDHNDEDGGVVQQTLLATNASYLVLNFCNRIDVFATLGTTHIHFLTNESVFDALFDDESKFDFGTHFSWSVGARATLLKWRCFGLGIEGEYFRTNSFLNYFLDYPTGRKFYFDDLRTPYREWQVALGASYRIATSAPAIALIPYAAVKWSKARLDMPHIRLAPFSEVLGFDVNTHVKSHKNWGGALGLSFTLCDKAGVTVEGRWGDEKAFFVNGQMRF